jgi:FkbM family methyltransferase
MLIPAHLISKYLNIKPKTILHIGAHLGEEYDDYKKLGWGEELTIWVESSSDLVKQLKNKLDLANNLVIECTAWSQAGVELNFNITNNSQSSSLLDLDLHKLLYPEISVVNSIPKITQRIDGIMPIGFSPELLNIDIQGAEKEALIGCGDLLRDVKYIYSEVNKVSIYRGCTLVWDLDDYLCNFGFKRILTSWYKNHGWGDALYVNFDKVEISKQRIFYLEYFLLMQRYNIKIHFFWRSFFSKPKKILRNLIR